MTIIERGIEFEGEDAQFFADGTVRDATLAIDAEIQGLPCAAGHRVVFYSSGQLKLAHLSMPTVVDDVPCPDGHGICLHENGRLMNASLHVEHAFADLVLPAWTRVTLDDDGELLEYWQQLFGDETIDGVPCSSLSAIWHYSSGKLSMALLSSVVEIDGEEYERGTKLWLDEEGKVIDSLVCNVDFSKKYKYEVCGVYQVPWE